MKNTKNLKLRTSLERLANYLVRQQKNTNSTVFDLNMEKRRLASSLGMTPENLSRAFKGLEPYGVCVKGGQIELIDLVALEDFAKPSELIDNFSS